MTQPNIYTHEFAYDPEDPPGFLGGAVHLTEATGGRELAVKLFELPPGERLCPYHYEFVEEWLIVLAGELDLRTPTGTERLVNGAVVCFPAGPEGAHTVANPGEVPARLMMFSSAHEPSLAIYPDSGKVGVWAPGVRHMFRAADGQVPYYDGEV